jgi:hypothetical protein
MQLTFMEDFMVSKQRTAMQKVSGAALAAAAAGLFMSGVVGTAAAAEAGKVHCVGINGCKGKSECKTSASDCKGQNACKGKGWVSTTEKMCKEKGGMVEKS